MTDNEIIKALKTCSEIPFNCSDCPYYEIGGCITETKIDALDLIRRQQAEIERLKDNKQIEISERLEKEIRSEAIKEFADRLKEKLSDCRIVNDFIYIGYDTGDALNSIDNLAKEMVGGDNE